MHNIWPDDDRGVVRHGPLFALRLTRQESLFQALWGINTLCPGWPRRQASGDDPRHASRGGVAMNWLFRYLYVARCCKFPSSLFLLARSLAAASHLFQFFPCPPCHSPTPSWRARRKACESLCAAHRRLALRRTRCVLACTVQCNTISEVQYTYLHTSAC